MLHIVITPLFAQKQSKSSQTEISIDEIARKNITSKTLYKLWKQALNQPESVQTFVDQHPEKHIIESIDKDNSLVTYFCIPTENTEYVMLSGGPDFLGLRFQQLGNTPLHYVSQRVPNDAIFNFGFNYFTAKTYGAQQEISDRDVDHAFDGLVKMPNAPVHDYSTQKKGITPGKLETFTLQSDVLKEERKITVYTPPTYDTNQTYPLLIQLDSETFGANLSNSSPRINAPVILDNLIHQNKITPIIVVFVWNMGKRKQDLTKDKFGDFISTEVIDWLSNKYSVNTSSTTLAGYSRSGYAACNIALEHSDVIHNVISQSGSFWITNGKGRNHWIYPEYEGDLIQAYKASPKKEIRFYMNIGLYDAGASMLGMNRELKSILEVKGYPVAYAEFKGGHNFINWEMTYPDGLMHFFPILK